MGDETRSLGFEMTWRKDNFVSLDNILDRESSNWCQALEESCFPSRSGWKFAVDDSSLEDVIDFGCVVGTIVWFVGGMLGCLLHLLSSFFVWLSLLY